MAFESLILDARGNPFVGTLDTIGNETITDARTSSFLLGALNAEVVMDIQGKNTFTFDARTSAAVLTYACEGTIDGTNYFGLVMWAQAQLLAAVAVSEQYIPLVTIGTTHSGLYTVKCTGLRRVRVRVSAYTSGNVTITPRGSIADYINYARPIPATFHVTVTAAANTAATITLPAVVGLFHYITYLECTRNATAALAGNATLIVTSTNLPGNPAWSNGNAMIAGGTVTDVFINGANPIRSAAAGVATTIVMPAAGAAVLNRGNCSYYLGV
jgi:hypothetical protein